MFNRINNNIHNRDKKQFIKTMFNNNKLKQTTYKKIYKYLLTVNANITKSKKYILIDLNTLDEIEIHDVYYIILYNN
jgi:hypothetical protein